MGRWKALVGVVGWDYTITTVDAKDKVEIIAASCVYRNVKYHSRKRKTVLK